MSLAQAYLTRYSSLTCSNRRNVRPGGASSPPASIPHDRLVFLLLALVVGSFELHAMAELTFAIRYRVPESPPRSKGERASLGSSQLLPLMGRSTWLCVKLSCCPILPHPCALPYLSRQRICRSSKPTR